MLVAAALLASFAAAAQGTRIVVPLQLVEGNNIVEADAGGTKLRVHVDTGGYKTIGVTSDALARMKVRFLDATVTRTDGSGAQFEGRTFLIPALRLGGHTFRDVPGFERKQAAAGGFGGPAPFDAVIGRDFLAPYTVVVDYPKRRIELHSRRAGPRICGAPSAPLTVTRDGFWASRVETDHGEFEMVWDTGARGASFIQERLVGARGLPINDDAYMTVRFRIGSVDAGPIELVPIPLTGFPNVDGLIGISVFATHRVCFDSQRSIVSIR